MRPVLTHLIPLPLLAGRSVHAGASHAFCRNSASQSLHFAMDSNVPRHFSLVNMFEQWPITEDDAPAIHNHQSGSAH